MQEARLLQKRDNYRIYELRIFKQHFLGRKETKEKRFMLLAKLDSMTNPSVVKIVPHWPNLMGQIREQTFATLYATPLPYCYVLAAVTEALESISFFVMCGIWQYRLWSFQGIQT